MKAVNQNKFVYVYVTSKCYQTLIIFGYSDECLLILYGYDSTFTDFDLFYYILFCRLYSSSKYSVLLIFPMKFHEIII